MSQPHVARRAAWRFDAPIECRYAAVRTMASVSERIAASTRYRRKSAQRGGSQRLSTNEAASAYSAAISVEAMTSDRKCRARSIRAITT